MSPIHQKKQNLEADFVSDRSLDSRLSSIETDVKHISKDLTRVIDVLFPLQDRVTRLQVVQDGMNNIPGIVAMNQEAHHVSQAVKEEREESKDSRRKDLMFVIGIASAVGSAMAGLIGIATWIFQNTGAM